MGLSKVGEYLDVIVNPQYDTGTILGAGTTTLITFFANPIGQGQSNFAAAGTAKTVLDTNMFTSSQLPAGYNFQVLGFRLAFSTNVTDVDTRTAINTAVFTFTIGSKNFLQVPAATIPGGNAPSGSGASLNSNGWPLLSNGYSVARKPLELSQTENFSASLTWPAGGVVTTTTVTGQPAAGLPIRCYLDGFLYRRMQ